MQINLNSPISVLAAGIALFANGIVFKINDWPDMFYGIFSGPVVILIGIFLIRRKKGKNKAGSQQL